MAAGPPPAELVSIVPAALVVQAQGQVELGAHDRLYKPLIESLVHGVGGRCV